MEDTRMYIFVNTELGMGKGKIAAQVGHVVQYIVEDILRSHYEKRSNGTEIFNAYTAWKAAKSPKIILKATQKEMEDLSKLPGSRMVLDAGKTQIPSGSFTVLGFLLPTSGKDSIKELFSDYKELN